MTTRRRTNRNFRLKDETGNQHGPWQVESRAPNVNGNARWRCWCIACGFERTIEGIQLRSKNCPRCNRCKRGKA